jgi:catechol 2,3-dioxygenase-like lactoylglutathione lyase family enzyme
MAIVGELMEVILYVQDMNAQVSFYRDVLGLQVTEPAGFLESADSRKSGSIQDFEGVFWVTLATGACTLALHAGGERRQGEDAPKIVFRVADVPGARDELLRRGVPMGEVRSPAPGVQVCDGLDPEGNKFSIESHTG